MRRLASGFLLCGFVASPLLANQYLTVREAIEAYQLKPLERDVPLASSQSSSLPSPEGLPPLPSPVGLPLASGPMDTKDVGKEPMQIPPTGVMTGDRTIPFDECIIEMNDPAKVVGAIGLVGKGMERGLGTLFCYSIAQKVATKVAITLDNLMVGPAVSVLPDPARVWYRLKARLHRENGKTLSDFFGNYKGVGVFAGLIGGGSLLSVMHKGIIINFRGRWGTTLPAAGVPFEVVKITPRVPMDAEIEADRAIMRNMELKRLERELDTLEHDLAHVDVVSATPGLDRERIRREIEAVEARQASLATAPLCNKDSFWLYTRTESGNYNFDPASFMDFRFVSTSAAPKYFPRLRRAGHNIHEFFHRHHK